MARHILFWKIDETKIPLDPKERATGWLFLMGLIKQDREKGLMKDWGNFLSEIEGYTIVEGSEVEIALMLQQYIPLVLFKSKTIVSADQIEEMLKAIDGA
jgi:hypothetical protein